MGFLDLIVVSDGRLLPDHVPAHGFAEFDPRPFESDDAVGFQDREDVAQVDADGVEVPEHLGGVGVVADMMSRRMAPYLATVLIVLSVAVVAVPGATSSAT